MQTVEKWVSLLDVASHLGVNRETIYRWRGTAGLPAYQFGRVWRAKLSEVDEWFRSTKFKAKKNERQPQKSKASKLVWSSGIPR